MKQLLGLLLVLALSGCAKQPYDRFHTGLEFAAEGLVHTDRIISESMDSSLDQSREAALQAAREAREACEVGTREDCPPNEAEFMEIYDHLTRGWGMIVQSMEVMKEVLLLAEVAATAWRDSKERPENLEQICQRIGEAQQAIVRGLDIVGVEIPEPWGQALSSLESVCTFVALEGTP